MSDCSRHCGLLHGVSSVSCIDELVIHTFARVYARHQRYSTHDVHQRVMLGMPVGLQPTLDSLSYKRATSPCLGGQLRSEANRVVR